MRKFKNVVLSIIVMTILTIIGITCSENATFTESLDHIEKTSLSNTLSKKGYNDIETSNEWDLVMDLGSQYGYKLYKNGWCDDYLQKIHWTNWAKHGILNTGPREGDPERRRRPARQGGRFPWNLEEKEL